ncbi:MAG: hypothetical protein ABIX01_18625 [Chitinophagaceae bacterium]
MESPDKKAHSLFYIYAFGFVIVALYHVNRYFFTPAAESATRHLVFVGICTICVFGLLKRPAWFLYFFGALTLQQIYGHGSHLLHQWNGLHTVNYIDLGVVVMTPVIFVSLIRNRHAAS